MPDAPVVLVVIRFVHLGTIDGVKLCVLETHRHLAIIRDYCGSRHMPSPSVTCIKTTPQNTPTNTTVIVAVTAPNALAHTQTHLNYK